MSVDTINNSVMKNETYINIIDNYLYDFNYGFNVCYRNLKNCIEKEEKNVNISVCSSTDEHTLIIKEYYHIIDYSMLEIYNILCNQLSVKVDKIDNFEYLKSEQKFILNLETLDLITLQTPNGAKNSEIYHCHFEKCMENLKIICKNGVDYKYKNPINCVKKQYYMIVCKSIESMIELYNSMVDSEGNLKFGINEEIKNLYNLKFKIENFEG